MGKNKTKGTLLLSDNDKVIILLSEMILNYNKLKKENFKDEFTKLVFKTSLNIDKIYNKN